MARVQHQVPTLLTLTTKQLTETGSRKVDFSQLSSLPPNLKDVLRKIFLKRGMRGRDLECLLHSNVKELDLCDCHKDEELLRSIKTCRNLRKLHINCDEVQVEDKERMTRLVSGVVSSNKFLRSLYLRSLAPVLTDSVLSCLHPHLQAGINILRKMDELWIDKLSKCF